MDRFSEAGATYCGCPAGKFDTDEDITNAEITCVDCPNPAACGAGNACNDGRTGMFCASCPSKFYSLNGVCHACPESDWWIMVLVSITVRVQYTFT